MVKQYSYVQVEAEKDRVKSKILESMNQARLDALVHQEKLVEAAKNGLIAEATESLIDYSMSVSFQVSLSDLLNSLFKNGKDSDSDV